LLAVEVVKPTAIAAYPKPAGLVLQDRPNGVVTETAQIFRVVFIREPFVEAGIVGVQPISVCAQPQQSVCILVDGQDQVPAGILLIGKRIGIVCKDAALWIETVQAVLGSDPQGSVPIF
jgi:hypothetical protein